MDTTCDLSGGSVIALPRTTPETIFAYLYPVADYGKSIAKSVVETEDYFVVVGPLAGLPMKDYPSRPNHDGVTPTATYDDTTLKVYDYGHMCVHKKTGLPVSKARRVSQFPRLLGPNAGADVPVIGLLSLDQKSILSGGDVQLGIDRARCDVWFGICKHDIATGELATDFGTTLRSPRRCSGDTPTLTLNDDANGDNDTFNGQGIVLTKVDPRGVNDEIFDMQWIKHVDNGETRLLVVGFSNPGRVHGSEPSFNFGLAQYHQNGQRDRTFGKEQRGTVWTEIMKADSRSSTFIVDEAGRIIAGGRLRRLRTPTEENFYHVYARYHGNGTIDTSFGMTNNDNDNHVNGGGLTNLSTEPGKVIHCFEDSAYCLKMIPYWSSDVDNSSNKKRLGGWFAGGRAGNHTSIFLPGKPGCAPYAFHVARYTAAGHIYMASPWGTHDHASTRISFSADASSNDVVWDMFDSDHLLYLVGSSEQWTGAHFMPPVPALAVVSKLTGQVVYKTLISTQQPNLFIRGILYSGKISDDDINTIVLVGTGSLLPFPLATESTTHASHTLMLTLPLPVYECFVP